MYVFSSQYDNCYEPHISSLLSCLSLADRRRQSLLPALAIITVIVKQHKIIIGSFSRRMSPAFLVVLFLHKQTLVSLGGLILREMKQPVWRPLMTTIPAATTRNEANGRCCCTMQCTAGKVRSAWLSHTFADKNSRPPQMMKWLRRRILYPDKENRH
jgi:hypothetical protein